MIPSTTGGIDMTQSPMIRKALIPWNKGMVSGQKKPLKLKEIWEIRIRLDLASRTRDLALFNLAIDSKLRGCDLVNLKVVDISNSDIIATRAIVMQKKTHQQVQFEITELTRKALVDWISEASLKSTDYLFPSKKSLSPHIGTRHYSRIVKGWIKMIGLNTAMYGTHSLRRTKVSLIYRRTKNLRAVQLLLGHSKLESTVRYLGVEIDDALDLAEHTEV
jgi:integrase